MNMLLKRLRNDGFHLFFGLDDLYNLEECK